MLELVTDWSLGEMENELRADGLRGGYCVARGIRTTSLQLDNHIAQSLCSIYPLTD